MGSIPVISSPPKGGRQEVSETVRFLLRAPRDIWDEIRKWAEEEDRSLNGQVVHILRRALAEWR